MGTPLARHIGTSGAASRMLYWDGIEGTSGDGPGRTLERP